MYFSFAVCSPQLLQRQVSNISSINDDDSHHVHFQFVGPIRGPQSRIHLVCGHHLHDFRADYLFPVHLIRVRLTRAHLIRVLVHLARAILTLVHLTRVHLTRVQLIHGHQPHQIRLCRDLR